MTLLRNFVLVLMLLLLLAFLFEKANAKEQTKTIIKNYSFTAGCQNLSTLKTQLPKDSSLTGCHLWKNYMRIMTPTKTQWENIKKIFKDDAIDVLPIINSESQFNHNARGPNKWWVDCGLLQIRDVYGGCKMTEEEQLKWLKNRIDSQKAKNWTCRSWIGNKERMIRCIYNRHNGKKIAFNSYDNKLMAQREFYKTLFKKLTF